MTAFIKDIVLCPVLTKNTVWVYNIFWNCRVDMPITWQCYLPLLSHSICNNYSRSILQMAVKNRPLHILKYLWDHTDEEHPAIITDILAYLSECGIETNRKTVPSDLVDLQESGFDVVCYRSRQNKYFIGSRSLELAELKMIVDANMLR